MNALDILKQDHQKVKGLFQEIRKDSDRGRQKELFDKIDTELEIHTHIEETVFYPAVDEHEEFKDMIAEALEEHQEAKSLLDELEELGADDHDFGSKLQQLMEAVEHHVEEEEGEDVPENPGGFRRRRTRGIRPRFGNAPKAQHIARLVRLQQVGFSLNHMVRISFRVARLGRSHREKERTIYETKRNNIDIVFGSGDDGPEYRAGIGAIHWWKPE